MATEGLATDRADPLQPATLALLQGDNRHAWQSLQQAWPALNSDAERRSWQGMLAALSAQHCGKDFPLTLPDEVGELRLELIQRDAPLLRDYRVQLTGEGAITAAELIDPAGRNRLEGAQWEAEEKSGVRVVGADLPTSLPAGLYQLRLTVAGKAWQVVLPLPAVQDLDWLSRSPARRWRWPIPPPIPLPALRSGLSRRCWPARNIPCSGGTACLSMARWIGLPPRPTAGAPSRWCRPASAVSWCCS
ncbi:DUF2861 family protein [Aeromonas jandaei]|uniref:DUF2861 family protein n=1 Tax=Aeromonas jandaei TaxID=650 RepID=UPI001F0C418D|nr:DUF2861 family protein [Aeromonas jandaei]